MLSKCFICALNHLLNCLEDVNLNVELFATRTTIKHYRKHLINISKSNNLNFYLKILFKLYINVLKLK